MEDKIIYNFNVFQNKLGHNVVGSIIDEKLKHIIKHFQHESNYRLEPDVSISFDLNKYSAKLDLFINCKNYYIWKIMRFTITSEKDYNSHEQYYCNEDNIIKCKTCQQELAPYTFLDRKMLLSSEGLNCKDLIVKKIII